MNGRMLRMRFCLGIAVTLTLLATSSCSKKPSDLTQAPPSETEEGIPMVVAIPLTPEQATALVGISEMSRIDEVSRTDEMSRVDEGIRGVALDISVDGQMAAEGIRGQIVGGVRGGIRGGEASGIRGGVRGALDRAAKAAPTRRGRLADPSRQAQDAPLLAFEATFRLPIHTASSGSINMGVKMRGSENPQVEYLEIKTTVTVNATADGSLDVQVPEQELSLGSVVLIDSDGDGVSTLTEAVVAGVEAALDSTTKPDEGAVKITYEQMAKKLEEKMASVGYEVKVDVTNIDLTPPDTTVTVASGFTPDGSSPDIKSGATVTFTFGCNETFCTYRCSLDDSPFAPCTSPLTPDLRSLTPGPHILSVKAADSIGNTDLTPASTTFFTDITPPEAISISIENGAEFINKSLVDVTVKAKDENAMEMFLAQDMGLFEVKTVIWIAYAEQTKFSMPTGDGKITVYVQFRDRAGNRSKIISDDITLDTKPPETAISSQPSAVSSVLSAKFEFLCSDPVAAPFTGASSDAGVKPAPTCTFMCQLDIGTPSSCVSPLTLSPLTEGSHIFTAYALDQAGNKDSSPATFSWSVDTTPPETAISGQPSAVSNQTSASFTFSCSHPAAGGGQTSPSPLAGEGAGGGCSFECDLDAAGFVACTTPKSYTSLTEGSHAFKVQARDAAGNVDASPASHTWTIDLTPPTVAFSSQPSAVSNQTSPTFGFTCSDPVGAGLPAQTTCTFQCSLAPAAFAACTSPVTLSVSEGSRTFQVKGTDAVGNTSSAVSYTWSVDATPPSAPVGANLTVNQNAPGTNDTIQGSAGSVENSSIVKVWADALLTTLLGQGTASASGVFDPISIGDNATATVFVTATDAAGNQSSSTSKTNDITPPVLSLTNVEGDGSSPFFDTVNDSNTDVAISAGDATTCKWDTTDIAYGSMANSCASTSPPPPARPRGHSAKASPPTWVSTRVLSFRTGR